MKRLLPTFVSILLFVPSFLAAQERSIRIGVMADQIPAELPALFAQMLGEINAVVGGEILLTQDDVRASGFDRDEGERIYREFVDGDTDLVLAFGPVSAAVLSGRDSYPKPTILFGGVNRDLLDLPEPGSTSGIPNFTYVITSESYERDLRAFKSLYAFRRLGIVLPPGPRSTLDLETRLAALITELDADFEVIPYTSIDALAESLVGIDAVYLLESLFIPDAEVAGIAELLIDLGIPSFSGARRDDVELGIMATNQPAEGLDSFFRRIALLVESVSNGDDLADEPVFFDVNQTLTLNFTTAQSVDVPIRYSLVPTTEFVGEYVNPLSERTYSLVDLVREALATNLGLEAERRGVRLSEADVRAARAGYLPSLNATVSQSILDKDLAAASGGLNPQYSTQGSVSVGQAVFSPDLNANIAIQRELLGAQREGLRAAEWDIILQSASAYFTALILKANVEIQNRNLDATKRNLRIAEQSFAAGQAGRGDVLRLRSESAQGMQALVEAVNALDQSFYALNQFVNQPITREIDVLDMTMEDGAFLDENFERLRVLLDDPSQRVPFEDFLVLEAIANAPEIRILEHNIDAVGRRIRLDGFERFLPTVVAGFDLSRTLDQSGVGVPDPVRSPTQFYSLGVSASIPLFDSNQRRISRQAGIIQRDQLRVDQDGAELALERNVRDAVLDLTNEIAGLGLTAISEDAAAESLELAQASYASGAVTVVELLDAQTNYLRAQLARASATYDFLATSVVVQRLVGHFFLLNSDAENATFLARFQEYLISRTPGAGS